MGRGSYHGGCTIIDPRSGWFSSPGPARRRQRRPAAAGADLAEWRARLRNAQQRRVRLVEEAAAARRRAGALDTERQLLDQRILELTALIRRLDPDKG